MVFKVRRLNEITSGIRAEREEKTLSREPWSTPTIRGHRDRSSKGDGKECAVMQKDTRKM